MEFILLLKPIFDMLWQFKILDVLLMMLIYIVTPLYLLKNRYKLAFIDLLFISLVVLFTISFIKNPTSKAFIDYAKIISNLYMFFIGRMVLNIDKKDNILIVAFIIVGLINLIYLITGIGFVHWGTSKTFRGIYFFKTDLALAILQSAIFIRLLKYNSNKYLNYVVNIYLFIISPVLIFLSNSRMYLLLYAIILYLYWNESNEKKEKKIYKYNLSFFLKIGLIFIGLIFLYSIIANTIPWFKENNLLAFKVEKFSDLFNESNSQGRNVIWGKIIEIFNSQPMLNKLIGVDLMSDIALHNNSYYDSHNNYLKILFTTGYLGIIISGLIFTSLMKNLNKIDNIKLKYTCLMLITSYMISSISYPSIIYTQQSWILFFYMGILSGQKVYKNKYLKTGVKVNG